MAPVGKSLNQQTYINIQTENHTTARGTPYVPICPRMEVETLKFMKFQTAWHKVPFVHFLPKCWALLRPPEVLACSHQQHLDSTFATSHDTPSSHSATLTLLAKTAKTSQGLLMSVANSCRYTVRNYLDFACFVLGCMIHRQDGCTKTQSSPATCRPRCGLGKVGAMCQGIPSHVFYIALQRCAV